jgi:DNA-binding transcriptional LysR family regulator
MDLNLVSAFVRVVEQQSFTGAAKALGLPKSSVSRRVTELEEQLGVRLLHRTTRKLALTEAGRAYFEHAERALSELEAAAESAAGMDSEPRGIVRMTCATDLAVMALPELLAEFTRLYPEIHVELSLSSRIANLQDEGFDIGLRAGKIQDPSLVVRRLCSTDLGLYASPAYLQQRGEPKQLADLAAHDCVLFRGQHGRSLWELQSRQETATIEVRGPITVDEMLFVRQAVGAGIGIGLLPYVVIKSCEGFEPKSPVVRVLSSWAAKGAELCVITPTGPKRPRRVTLLRDFLYQRLVASCPAAEALHDVS